MVIALLLLASLAVVAAGMVLVGVGVRFLQRLDEGPLYPPLWLVAAHWAGGGLGVLGGAAIAITGIVATMTNVVALAGLLT